MMTLSPLLEQTPQTLRDPFIHDVTMPQNVWYQFNFCFANEKASFTQNEQKSIVNFPFT